MGRFKDIYDRITGAKPEPAAKRERIRQTAADEHQSRKEARAEPAAETPQDLFLAGLHKLTIGTDFQSSNPDKPAVYQVWYDPKAEQMYVTFFDHSGGVSRIGPTYKYWPISLREAEAMYRDGSKGESVWTNFRIRGSKTLHRKNYAKVSP